MLKGKSGIITGCSRGIGKQILETFAKNGANIFACVRKESKDFSDYIEKLASDCGVKIIPIYADMSVEAEVKDAFNKIRLEKLPIDFLVNNAGVSTNSLFQMSTMQSVREQFEVNFFAVYLFTQYVSKLMTRQKSGSIINIASTAGLDANAGRSAYGASKAALICMTKAVARELGEFNVRANCIAPGITKTDMIGNMSDEVISNVLADSDLKRIGQPTDIANAALFLASDMSSYVTGQCVRVDGGLKA